MANMPFKAQGEFGALKIQRKGDGFAYLPADSVFEKQLQLGSIGRDQPEFAPLRRWQMPFDQLQQLLVEQRKSPMFDIGSEHIRARGSLKMRTKALGIRASRVQQFRGSRND